MKPPKNLGQVFDWHADRTRTTNLVLDRPFDISPTNGVHYNAQALADLVREASGWLYTAGARKGDRIAVVKRNHFDMIVLAAAAARIGATAATISAANRSVHLAEILKNLDPALTLISAQVVEEAERQSIDLGSFATTVLLDQSCEVRLKGGLLLDDLRGGPVPAANFKADHEHMMITHTSGTTSTPKLVAHTADSCRAGTRLELLPAPLIVSGRKDVYLSSISFGHSRAYAWTFAQFRWAPKSLVIASSHAIADVERVLEQTRPTMVEATPNVFQHWLPLVRRRPELFERVRYYMNTFDLMHPSIARPFANASKRGLVMWGHSWGQSEVGPIAGTGYPRGKLNSLADLPNGNMNTMGWPWPGLVKAKIADPDTGRRLKQGEVGVIFVKSKSVCADYVGESHRHKAKLTDWWWNTGDTGYKDRFGRIHFTDRAVDAIPGHSATELESVLLERIKDAAEVVVLTRGNRAPVPVVSLEERQSLSDEEWTEAIRGLPVLEPPVIMPWHELPRTSTWKVRRKELREKVFAEAYDDTVLDERFT